MYKNYSKKILYYSLLFIAAFMVLIIFYASPGFEVIKSGDNKIVEHQSIKKMYIVDWENHLAMFIFFFLILNLFILSIFLFFDYKNEKISFIDLFFGIFFLPIPLVYLLNIIKKNRKIKSYLFSKRFVKMNKKFFLSLLIFLMTPFIFIYPFFIKEIREDKPWKNYDIKLSVNPNKTNMIFLFIDGLSAERIEKFNLENKIQNTFNNFVYFRHSISHGIVTKYGEPAVFGNEENIFMNPNHGVKNALNELFRNYHNFKRFSTNNSYFVNPQLIGGIYAGKAAIAEARFREYNTKAINWSRSREEAFKHNEIFNHHFINNIKYMGWKAKRFSSTNNSSFVFLYDESLHYLHTINNEGHVVPFGTEKNEYNATLSALSFTFNKWRELKSLDGTTNAFDNSTIVVVGDHGSHESQNPTFSNPGSRSMTASFIKFPNFHNKLTTIRNRTLWTPFINKIIKNYYDNNSFVTQNEFKEWIANNINFDPNTPRLVTFGSNVFGDNHEKISSSLLTFQGTTMNEEYHHLKNENENIFYIYDKYKQHKNELKNLTEWKV